jgi:hypothetical protein
MSLNVSEPQSMAYSRISLSPAAFARPLITPRQQQATAARDNCKSHQVNPVPFLCSNSQRSAKKYAEGRARPMATAGP